MARTGNGAVRAIGAGRPRIRAALSWLHVLAVAGALLVAFAFLYPAATYAPALRAAIETMITSLALTSAWLVQAQFVRTRRSRDLLLFGALLTLAAIELVAYCVPAALTAGVGSHFAAVGLWGNLFAAAAFAAAALTPAERLIGGGRLALAVSRGTISSLSDPGSATTYDALEALADELRARFEVAITVDGGLDVEPAPYVREDLCRIAREAIANGVRHGGAEHVIVSLRRTPKGIKMRVSDDGCGIGFRELAGEGFGLGSLRERAAAMGGQLSVKQSGKRGTELEVTIP